MRSQVNSDSSLARDLPKNPLPLLASLCFALSRIGLLGSPVADKKGRGAGKPALFVFTVLGIPRVRNEPLPLHLTQFISEK